MAVRIWSAFVATLAILLAMLGGLVLQAGTAYACSILEDYHPVHSSRSIVEGRILDWEETGEFNLTYRVQVEHVHKGDPATTDGVLTVHDFGSYFQGSWGWGGGLCGTFGGDPSGLYIVVGLESRGGEHLQSQEASVFFLGPAAAGRDYDEAIASIHAELAPGPPATGSGLATGSMTSLHGITVAVLVMLVSAVAVRLAWFCRQ